MNERVARLLINTGWALIALAIIFGPVALIVGKY